MVIVPEQVVAVAKVVVAVPMERVQEAGAEDAFVVPPYWMVRPPVMVPEVTFTVAMALTPLVGTATQVPVPVADPPDT